MNQYDPVTLAVILALMALVPTLAVVSTSFLKISVVMMLVRNALGVQQAPPNIAVYGMALILSAYVMAPVSTRVLDAIGASGGAAAPATLMTGPGLAPGHTVPLQGSASLGALISGARAGAEPLKDFLDRNSNPIHQAFFLDTARRLWKGTMAADVSARDLLILVPAFMLSELDAAFKAGFLLYLPFVLIDLIVSNVLLAMGMMMVSPITISLPLKLFLFVMADGWTRLIQGLVLSYH